MKYPQNNRCWHETFSNRHALPWLIAQIMRIVEQRCAITFQRDQTLKNPIDTEVWCHWCHNFLILMSLFFCGTQNIIFWRTLDPTDLAWAKKSLLLCSKEGSKSYRFAMTRGWENDDRFLWVNLYKHHSQFLKKMYKSTCRTHFFHAFICWTALCQRTAWRV